MIRPASSLKAVADALVLIHSGRAQMATAVVFVGEQQEDEDGR